jgi:L-threonylcarbamoyladenylate synthase
LDLFAEGDITSGRHVDTVCALLRAGAVGILPTDTIYGLSGNALDDKVVRRIARLKRRRRPATIIPTTLDFLDERARVARVLRSGETVLVPYRGAVFPRALTSTGYVGLRRPRHWITALVERAGVPLVTTSVNITGHAPMTSLDDLAPSIKRGVDFLVYAGPLEGRASPIRWLDRDERVVR